MKNKIDWLNHGIAFFSALAGIFLAFQLDSYLEERNEKENAKKVLLSIKNELEANQNILKEEIPRISIWLDFIRFHRDHYKPDLGMVVSERTLDSAINKWNGRFRKPKFIRKFNDSLNVYESMLVIDFIISETSTNNWEAAKFSGALNHIDHEIVAQLSLAYYWLNKPYGENEKKEIDLLLFHATIPDNFIEKYESVRNAYQIKLGQLNDILSKIDWQNNLN